MELNWDTRFDVNRAANLLLEIAHEKSVCAILDKVVDAAISRPHMGCVQIWLVDNVTTAEPGDSTCSYLRLVAARGRHLNPEITSPVMNFDDPKSRMPVGAGLIGRAVQNGEQLWVNLAESGLEIDQGFDWVRTECIQGVGVTPIIYREEVLGALVGFARGEVVHEARPWGRIFADHIGAAIANARAFEEIQRLKAQVDAQNTYLQEEVVEAKAFGELVGQSAALRQIISQIDLVAPTEAAVLIFGETGTGKELVAREIHRRSNRKDGPLVRVNCASIPRELFESEFFGHVKGAFTGAHQDRAGRFETANSGTIFLDEIGEIPLEMQNKLLRVLQEKSYERVGDDRTRQANVRVIAATNRDLKKAVSAGKFREDLYYRLHVFPINVPTLRERTDDIPFLAKHFVEVSVRELKCAKPRLTRAGVAQLHNYDWPGNVRELRNVIERAVILARGGPLEFDLPIKPVAGVPPLRTGARSSGDHPPGRGTGLASADTVATSEPEYLTEAELQRRERDNLIVVLRKTNWRIKGPEGAAELLGVKPTTLISRLEKWGLKKPAVV